ncbi:MAG: hypothetical protein Q4G66_07590 [bacterium]|nr:hypothetical protein [bacterium]
MHDDPFCEDPVRRVLIKAAELEAEQLLAEHPLHGQIGYCHLYWATMKRILLERHGIDWKSPVEMNPDVFFD